ncbi:MAG: DUF3592 domain-containing protein [Campylobacterota bacterium]
MILFYIVGMIFATLGLFMLLDTYFFRKKARTVQGSVVGYEKKRSKNGYHYYPVVRYSDQGDTYQFKSDIGSNTMSFSIDEDVDVLILENRHSSARLKRMARPVLALAFLFMGVIPIVLSISEIKSADNQIYALQGGVLLLAAGTFILLRFSKLYRDRTEKKFTYQRNKSGVVGYETTQDVITDAHVVQKATVSKTAHAFGAFTGAVMVAGALYWAEHLHAYLDSAVRTQGVIVSQKSSYSDGSTTYAPIIEFAPYKSKTVRFTSNVSSSSPSWKVGDSVNVFYDPNDTDDAIMDRGWFNYFFQLMLGLIGFIILGVSSWQLWKKSQAKQ